ncbi:MAG: CBS domain-containing protein [Pseudomonadota bacterium]
MNVKEIMTENVDLLSPADSLEKASQLMRDDDIGAIPVREGDRLVGMLTDRDIAVRAVAEGREASSAQVKDAMSSPVLYCYENDSVEEVGRNMAKNQIRRLPVLNKEKRLVGMVSLGDLACKDSGHCAEEALRVISKPAQPH